MASLKNEYDKFMDWTSLNMKDKDFSIPDYHYSYDNWGRLTGEDSGVEPVQVEIDFKEDSEYKDLYGTKYSFEEDVILKELTEYIDSTYKGHYTNKNNSIQGLDIWKARGSMSDTCIDTAIKYLMRYGKKEGKNMKDLLKAAHYIILAMGNERS